MPRRHRAGTSDLSVFARIEEIVLAASGVDAFELVFSLAAAWVHARAHGEALDLRAPRLRRGLAKHIEAAARAWPGLEPSRALEVPDDVLVTSLGLLELASLKGEAEGLDSLFEQLVTRVGKGAKGQFFTPRHVVDLATRALSLRDHERFLDPACGSGAFVTHALRTAGVRARGWDVDGRAVRVAKLSVILAGRDPACIERHDSLSGGAPKGPLFDVIATNPPFAGEPDGRGYEVARLGGRAERDVLFLERCLSLLRPGGRLAIVLPHGKVASRLWTPLRRWLVARARVLAVISLPRETFLPHTSQRAALVFLQKRKTLGASLTERVLLAVSDRAGRDVSGAPVFRPRAVAARSARTWRDHDHDLGEIDRALRAFLRREGFIAGGRARPRARNEL